MAAGTTGRTTAVATQPRKHEQVLPARPDQVRVVRAFLAAALAGCPAADDAILCASELASNSILHSDSKKPGGTFTIYAEMHDDYVWVEVKDDGGPWNHHAHADGRPHGLDIVRALATDSGLDGDPLTGWVVWARINWPPARPPHPASQDLVTAPAGGPAPGAETTSQALTSLRAALAALGIATAGLTLTRYTGKLHPEHGPVIGYHAGLYWWPARRRHASRPIYTIHDARDPAGAARRIAPHYQPPTLAKH